MYSSEALSERHLHINSCGRQILSSCDTYTLRKNGRIDYHILYILSGNCYAIIDGKEYKVTEGHAAMYLPGQTQEYRFYKKDKSESVWIHFTGTGCESYLRELELYGKPTFEVGKGAELLAAVNSMIRTKSPKTAENENVSDGYLYIVLALMSRASKYGHERMKRFSEISKVITFIGENYKNALSVSEYAAMCHLSKSRFEHVFKEYTGTTPTGYIFKTRVEAAMRLLENTDLRISQIAEEVGFDDANYFTRIFKKYSGTSPVKYRGTFTGKI